LKLERTCDDCAVIWACCAAEVASPVRTACCTADAAFLFAVALRIEEEDTVWPLPWVATRAMPAPLWVAPFALLLRTACCTAAEASLAPVEARMLGDARLAAWDAATLAWMLAVEPCWTAEVCCWTSAAVPVLGCRAGGAMGRHGLGRQRWAVGGRGRMDARAGGWAGWLAGGRARATAAAAA
jgi:hypothetical protein